mmetsp:Transcript_43915/g.103894  ORF Transcript_43915/g.103894 Transcript_43915/m.103894 type:complete len:227 (+) Transcript_43915:915-1595(+)
MWDAYRSSNSTLRSRIRSARPSFFGRRTFRVACFFGLLVRFSSREGLPSPPLALASSMSPSPRPPKLASSKSHPRPWLSCARTPSPSATSSCLRCLLLCSSFSSSSSRSSSSRLPGGRGSLPSSYRDPRRMAASSFSILSRRSLPPKPLPRPCTCPALSLRRSQSCTFSFVSSNKAASSTPCSRAHRLDRASGAPSLERSRRSLEPSARSFNHAWYTSRLVNKSPE